MKPDFDYSTVPQNFIYCLNNECPHAEECLRQQISQRLPTVRKLITIVNPQWDAPAKEKCTYFLADKLIRYGRGMTHMLERLPYNDAVAIKRQMLFHFGRTLFYRLWRKERLFDIEQQKYIRQLFRNKGITEEPMYDEYVDQYDW